MQGKCSSKLASELHAGLMCNVLMAEQGQSREKDMMAEHEVLYDQHNQHKESCKWDVCLYKS